MYTLGDVPRKGATVFPDKVAMVFEGTRVTYREMDERVNRFANALMELGCKKGDRLAILSENTYKYMEVYFAAAKAGMSVTPLNFRLSDEELTHIVNASEAIVYVAGDGYEEQSFRLKSNVGNIQSWIALDNKSDGYLFYEDLLAGSSKEDPLVDVDEDEMAILAYTGGTTGLPKGVMLSHRNLLTVGYQLIISIGLTRQDTTCLILPVFHLAFWPALCLLMVGGISVIVRRPELVDIMRTIENERCTHINAVPTIYGWMLNHPQLNDFDLTSLRNITYGGSPIPADVARQLIRKFGNILSQGYAMTEALGGTFLLPEDHVLEGENAKRLMSAGKESLIAKVRIVDEDGVSVESGTVGEIAIQGKHVMKGYWKNPELTEKVLRNGWYHTGDMGYMDEDSYLFLVDRKADMIVTGGENVYPKETEDVLYKHPGVQECAVVSAPDELWGERVQAVVVLKPGQTATEEELINHCKGKLAGYKCPKILEFWEQMPKTPLGKILRKEVKAHFWKGKKRGIG